MLITQEIMSDFREWYPEFGDTTKWPDTMLKKALCKADYETGGSCWGQYESTTTDCTIKKMGLFALGAHSMVTRYAEKTVTASGGVATAMQTVSSKSVGDESISYASPDLARVSFGDSVLASTNYGLEFIRMRDDISTGFRARPMYV